MARHRKLARNLSAWQYLLARNTASNKRQFITLETDDPAEAVKRANQIRQAPNLNASSPLLNEIERFIDYKRRMNIYTRSTATSKNNVLKLFAASMHNNANAASITTRHIQDFYDKTRERTTDTTAAGYLMTIRSFFRWAAEKERIARRNPAKDVIQAKPRGRARESFCDFETRDKLIGECKDESLKFILFCGFHAGLRFQEIVEARPFWFDLSAGQLNLRKTATMNFKDREERTIPLTVQFKAFLKNWMHEPFMLKPNVKQGKAIYRYDFRKPFTKYMKEKGCEGVTPHIMRHTFASLLVSAEARAFTRSLFGWAMMLRRCKSITGTSCPTMAESKKRSPNVKLDICRHLRKISALNTVHALIQIRHGGKASFSCAGQQDAATQKLSACAKATPGSRHITPAASSALRKRGSMIIRRILHLWEVLHKNSSPTGRIIFWNCAFCVPSRFPR